MSAGSFTPQPVATATWHTILPSVIGELTVVRDEDGLRGLYFRHHWHRPDPKTFGPQREPGFEEVAEQINDF